MRKLTVFVLFSILIKINGLAQYQPVFTDLTGQELLDSLVKNYKPAVVLSQSFARDTLFARVYAHHDSLTCVYTGYKIYLNPNEDPTQDAFAKGINTEHTFPQSLGAMNQAESDMHHLYPTREDVNADRGNLPFAEIPDNQTDDWYYLGQQLSNIPSSNIDWYSERKDGFFEPREDHKGNVARAMFYFYTMYKAQADAASPNFFESQRSTLCAWHLLDPVNQAEWSRTWKIAEYQSGRPNPFVLDCTLPERCYCEEFQLACTPVAVNESAHATALGFEALFPNPVSSSAQVLFSLREPGSVQLEVYSSLGQKLEEKDLGHYSAGLHQIEWTKKADANAGICFFRLVFSNRNEISSSFKKVVVLP